MGSLRNVKRKLTHRLRPSCFFVGVVISVLLCMVWAVHSLRAVTPERPPRSYYAMEPGDHGVDDRNASLALEDPDPASFDAPVLQGVESRTPLTFSVPYEAEWRVHPHLVVYGVMTTDVPLCSVMRNSQRQTWLRYAPVATYDTSFEGLMLVLYVVSPRNTTPPYVSNAMLLEMEDYHDVLMLRLKEELPTINRTIGGPAGLRYGDALYVSNTRKMQGFLLYAYRSFPSTPFVAVGDDDSYVYVPEYVRMLMQLPRVSTVYGYISNEGATYFSRIALGYAYTLTRDIVVDVLQDPLIAYLFQRPYDAKLISLYYYTRYHHDDNVIGAVFSRENKSGRGKPTPPTPDDRLPPVEGWGKAYMAYAMEPHRVPNTGRAVGSDGRYDVTYAFPQPDKFRPHDVLWVYDICRYDRRSRPDPTSPMRSIASNRTITREDYAAHWEYDQALGEDTQMARPSHLEVVSVGHYNDVDIVVAGRTSASCHRWTV